MNKVMIKEAFDDVTITYRNRLGGEQYIIRFPNNYGASVIKHDFSYGHEQGLWELAVVKFYERGLKEWDVVYDTDITDDVIGWLTDEDVLETLGRIKEL